jgi:hypothetical protein
MGNTKILYLESGKRDFISDFLMKPNNKGHWLRPEDSKIEFNRRPHPNPPWLYVKINYAQECHFWHRQLFDNVLAAQKMIPIPCHECWKVVVMPRNLQELMAVWLMQREICKPSKCGTEGDRQNTDRLYGGYWYNWSKDEGLERFEEIKSWIDKKKTYEANVIGAPVKERLLEPGDKIKWFNGEIEIKETLPIILKRACTEYEQQCGRSDEWSYTEDQVDIEKYAASSFVREGMDFSQSEMQLAHIWRTMIHGAFQWGDKSYLRFTNGNKLFAPAVVYHDGGKPFRPPANVKEAEALAEKSKSTKEVAENGKERA